MLQCSACMSNLAEYCVSVLSTLVTANKQLLFYFLYGFIFLNILLFSAICLINCLVNKPLQAAGMSADNVRG